MSPIAGAAGASGPKAFAPIVPVADAKFELALPPPSRRSMDADGNSGVDLGAPRTRWNRFREFMLERVVRTRWFDNIVLTFILLNCISLALDNPLDDPNSQKQRLLKTFDMVWFEGGTVAPMAVCVKQKKKKPLWTEYAFSCRCVRLCLRCSTVDRYSWRYLR